MMRMSVPASERWSANLCRSMCTVTGLVSSALRRHPASFLQRGDADRVASVPAGEQAAARPCQPPIGRRRSPRLFWRGDQQFGAFLVDQFAKSQRILFESRVLRDAHVANYVLGLR